MFPEHQKTGRNEQECKTMAVISSETWEEILQAVKEKYDIPDISFRTWLQPLKVQDVRDYTIVVLVTTGVMGVEYISK